MNKRARDLIAVFLMQLVLTLPFYTASAYGITISNVRVSKATSSSATIEWNTDNISNGMVKYGSTAALGFTQRHDNFVNNHTISVFNGIASDTLYFFSVHSTDLSGAFAADNNSNNFHTFRTADITPPPQVTGLRALSSTTSSVALSWNNLSISDLSHYAVYKGGIRLANTSSNLFNDTGLSSGTTFAYKVSAVDNSGNEGVLSDTLIASTLAADVTKPAISGIELLQTTDTAARITWLTNENSTTEVFYGINKTDKAKSIAEFTTNHSIAIDGLLKNANYAFLAQSCDASNNCANSSLQKFVSFKDTALPFINLSIPRYVNRRVINIIGSTKPFSSTTLFVNNMNIPLRSLGSSEVGSTGSFAFTQIQLLQDNAIKVVAADRYGIKNQKTFEVSVDTEEPAVQLNEIPSGTSKSNLTISGSVNEPVVIRVFVDVNANESSVPAKIIGLNATKIGQNSVELHWGESDDKDFSHYVVYREDASPIALTKPANFNLFIDALVDSGKSYTYQVSAVNIFGNEGPKSEPITATTLKDGAILNLKPPEVDIFEDFRKPVLSVNVTGSFNFGVKLNKGEKTYHIKLIFEDRAGNSVLLEKNVVLDTKKPVVKITSPPGGALVFENVANEIDIVGKTKPNARVHLFIDRTPYSSFTQTLEVTGLPNEAQNTPQARFEAEIRDLPIRLENSSISEEQLDAKCRFNVAARSSCRTGADFSVTADGQGNFIFEKVDLTEMFGGATRLREVSPTEFRDTSLNEESRQSKNANILVIATDSFGQKGFITQTVRIGTCWSGNQSWNVISLTQYQSPTLLSTERIAEGTETIYFYLNYSYLGRGHDGKITSISLSKACGTSEVLDPRFNISCKVMPSGNSPTKLNPDGTLSYSALTLSRLPGMDTFMEDDWKGFFKAINKEMTFPFKIRITYEHEVIDSDGQSKRIKETQTVCEQVTYVVDNSIIDPRKVLPDWLLYDFVDFLKSSIKTLTDAQEKIDKVLNYVAIGCLTSFGLNFVLQSARRIATIVEEKAYAVLNSGTIGTLAEKIGLGKIKLAPANKDDEQYCQDLVKTTVSKRSTFKFRYVTDADLKKCFPHIDAWWGREASVYSLMRWSCDRVFGHAAPAAWTESKDDTELLSRVESGEGCAVDQSVRGQPLKAESCKDAVSSFPLLPKEGYGLDDKCFRVNAGNTKSLFRLGQQLDGKIYEIETVRDPANIGIGYAIKRDEFNYLTAKKQTCDEVCGIKSGSKKQLKILGDQEASLEVDKKGNEKGSVCTIVDKCRSLNARDANKKFVTSDGNTHDIKAASPSGYTSDCFYKAGDPISVVSDLPSQREECCCINSKAGAPARFYQPDDVDIVTGQQVHESKAAGEAATPSVPPTTYADMKWSYRYSKEKFEAKGKDGVHTEYNPNRYIQGRDQPACFGQNSIYDGINPTDGKVLIVDPFKEHAAAFVPCVHLGGISNRIQFLKNLMTSLSTCLIQVRTTGRGDAGACRELITQHLCGLIWQAVRAFIDGCVPIGTGVNIGDQDDDYALGTYLKAGFQGITQSASDLQNSLTQEYGNAKLNEFVGTGEGDLARKVCLGAFGYGWEFDIKNLVDAAYSSPFATLVQPVTRSREFLTVDPVSIKPKYEYRASWIINPGCDFERYDIYLSCVGRKQLDQYPNSVNCGAIGAPSIAYTGALGTSVGYSQCSCINMPDEKVGPLVFSGRLRQNVLEDRKAFNKVYEDVFRYDHLKFVLRPDRKITSKVKPNCFPQGFDDGVFYFPLIDKTARDILDCTLDYVSGQYTCGSGAAFFSRKGTAEIVEVTINGDNANKVKEVSLGEPLEVGATVVKTGADKCLRVSISPDPIQPVYAGITLNGSNQYPAIRLTDSLSVYGRTGSYNARNVIIKLLSQNNPDPVPISIRAIDDTQNKNKIYDKSDTVQIDGITVRFDDEGDQGDEQTRIKVNYVTGIKDKPIIRVEKRGAIIEITGISYTQAVGGDYGAAETIIINPLQQISQGSQQKTITVELFHIKDDAGSYNNDAQVCSLNDKIFSRSYSFVVSDKRTDASTLGPVIQTPRINPTRQVIGNPVEISARITHPSRVEESLITIYDPSNDKKVESQPMTHINDDVGFVYTFDTNGMNPGQYTGKIDATSKADTKSNSPIFKFQLTEPR